MSSSSLRARHPLLSLLLAPALACPVWAQTATVTSGPVVVTATRIEQNSFDLPVSIDSVSREQIQDGQLGVNLSESLARIPGIVAQNRQNYAQDLQISSRGFGARSAFGVRGIRLYSDGIPATMPDGQGQVSHFDLGSAAKIEIMRGPFSSLYGNSAGGVISIFTEDGQPDGELQGGITFGSFATEKTSVKLSADTGNFNYVVSASDFKTRGYRYQSVSKRRTFNSKLRWKLGNDTNVTLVANAVDSPLMEDPLGLTRSQVQSNPQQAGTDAAKFNTRKKTDQEQLGAILAMRLSPSDDLTFGTYVGRRKSVQFQSTAIATQTANDNHAGGVVDLGRQYWGVDARWTHRGSLAGRPLTTSAGINYDSLGEERRGYENFVGTTVGVLGGIRRNEKNTIFNFDQYIQSQWDASERLQISAGLRNSVIKLSSQDKYIVNTAYPGTNGDDSGSTSYSAVTGSLGATYRLLDTLNLYASWGKGFETPTLNEVAYQSTDGSRPGLNFALRPARSRTTEIGAKALIANDVSANIAVFRTDTSDEIATQSSANGRTVYQNAGRTRRNGLEIASEAKLPLDLTLTISHTWLQAIYQDSTGGIIAGRYLPAIPKTVWFAELGWKHVATGLNASVDVRHTGKVFVNDANSDAASSYGVVNLRFGFEQKAAGWSLKEFLRVDNVGNKRYVGSVIVNQASSQFFEPAPGRNFLFGVSANNQF